MLNISMFALWLNDGLQNITNKLLCLAEVEKVGINKSKVRLTEADE